MCTLVLILKGMIVGIGKIMPGVSGGMLAITLNIYDKGIDAISNFFKNIRENASFLCKVGVGIIISILFMSKIIRYLLEIYYLPTMLLFIGLIVGGFPMMFLEVKSKINVNNILITVISFVCVTSLSIISAVFSINGTNKFSHLFFMGVLDAFTMVVPGISGTALLMMFGYYDTIINCLSNFTDLHLFIHNLEIITPFLLGLLFGVMTLIKIVDYLLRKYHSYCCFAILGFILSSIFILFKQTLSNNYSLLEVLTSLVFMLLGYLLSRTLEKFGE